MAQAGAVAGRGGGAGVGAGAGGEQDVPDIRFLMRLKIDVQNRSKSWLQGNKNSPFNEEISLEDKEKILIPFLKRHNVAAAELNTRYRASYQLRRQAPEIVEQNDLVLMLSRSLGRKRRHVLFLKIVLRTHNQLCKNFKLPPQYKVPAQLEGDINSMEEEIKALFQEIEDACSQIMRDGGIAVQIPKVFMEPAELPSAK